MAKPASDSELLLLAKFRAALRRFLRFSEDAARDAGLTPQQHQALLALRVGARGGRSVGEIAEDLAIRPHSAVGLVDRLVAARLATRVRSATDRRKVLVRLAPAGRRLLARLGAAHRDELRRIGPELGELLRELEVGE